MSRRALLLSLLVLSAPMAWAQDPGAEVRQLEEMLERVDAALGDVRPLTEPVVKLQQYDVRHLLFRPDDAAAPSLWVPSEAAGYRSSEGAGGSFSFDSEEEAETGVLEEDRLQELLLSAVGDDEAWDDPCSLDLHRGYLFVRQTAVGHARIRRVLDELSRRAVQAVQLDVGFYALPPEVEARLRAGALAADGVLSPEALAALDGAVAEGKAALARSATLTALDGQRIYLHQGTERAYLAGFEQSAGGTEEISATVADPLVEVLRAGLALDVRPSLMDDESGRVALDVRFARSRVLRFEQRQTPWGAMAMPQVTMDSVRTSAQVPAGSGMLVFAARGDGSAAAQEEGAQDVVIVVRPRSIR